MKISKQKDAEGKYVGISEVRCFLLKTTKFFFSRFCHLELLRGTDRDGHLKTSCCPKPETLFQPRGRAEWAVCGQRRETGELRGGGARACALPRGSPAAAPIASVGTGRAQHAAPRPRPPPLCRAGSGAVGAEQRGKVASSRPKRKGCDGGEAGRNKMFFFNNN